MAAARLLGEFGTVCASAENGRHAAVRANGRTNMHNKNLRRELLLQVANLAIIFSSERDYPGPLDTTTPSLTLAL